MCQWIGSALVQAMTCRLFGTRALPEPMLTYCKLDPQEQTPVEFESKNKIFIHENAFEDVVCEIAATLSRSRWKVRIWWVELVRKYTLVYRYGTFVSVDYKKRLYGIYKKMLYWYYLFSLLGIKQAKDANWDFNILRTRQNCRHSANAFSIKIFEFWFNFH